VASPDEMAEYYDGFPPPPEEPATDEEMEEFEQAQAAHEDAFGPPPAPSPVSPPPAPAGGAGLPAARQGDMTAHGGAIAVGYPPVMIGNKPAARITDMHTCPMVNGVVPHVGGPIAKGSTSVMIGFMFAARMTDQATCTGPPDMIAQGEFTVLIG
jgi:uncharacterized Zn-binding protein involved in type VI secretion